MQSVEAAWRAEPEAVAQEFVETQLQLSGGTWDGWNEAANSMVYHAADGAVYTLQLEQPIHNPYQPEQTMWVVAAYTSLDAEGNLYTEVLL